MIGGVLPNTPYPPSGNAYKPIGHLRLGFYLYVLKAASPCHQKPSIAFVGRQCDGLVVCPPGRIDLACHGEHGSTCGMKRLEVCQCVMQLVQRGQRSCQQAVLGHRNCVVDAYHRCRL